MKILLVLTIGMQILFRAVYGLRPLSRPLRARFHYDRSASLTEGPMIPVGSMGSGGVTPLLISVEGNIGAGKSTLLDALRELNKDWIFIDEPVKQWSSLKNELDESMLEVFYKDRRRWSYTFQNCALLTRYQCIEEAIRQHSSGTGHRVFVTERCLDTDYYVFTKMLREDGSLDKLEFDLYERWFKQLKRTSTPLSGIVHVDTSPDVSAQRIVKRGREGEQAIELGYLRSLDKYQRAWIDAGAVPSIRADVNDADRVREFVEKLIPVMR